MCDWRKGVILNFNEFNKKYGKRIPNNKGCVKKYLRHPSKMYYIEKKLKNTMLK